MRRTTRIFNMAAEIALVPDADFYKSGTTRYIKWDYRKFPHMVIFGSTGSGKTYLLKIILGRIGKHIPGSMLVICDYKSDEDFSFLEGLDSLYRFDRCMEGLELALRLLQDRQHGAVPDRRFFCLVFDEWASFINDLDKKQSDYAKKCLSSLLMLGRSFNIHVIVSQQRLDASYFNASRDNFSVVFGLGTLSKESVSMMFSDFKEDIDRVKPQGRGSLAIGGRLRNIVVPTVQSPRRMQDAIAAALRRSGEADAAQCAPKA